MLKIVVILVIAAIVSGKPVEYDDEYDYQSQSAALPSAPTQQAYYDGDSEERSARNVRQAQSDVVPTIQLGDLISAVEHTLVHSNHNLAIANATNASFNSTESSTVISLPITLPTPSTEATLLEGRELVTDETETTTVFETTTELEEAVTTSPVDASNINIIQTINSSQITPSETSDGVRVQLQHITLFSAGAGIFPNLPSVNLDALTINSPVVADEPKSITDVSEGSSSSEENSDECSPKDSDDSAESNESKSSKCAKTSVDSESHVQKIKKAGLLQEKLAEVAADPVILTQGI